MTYSNTRVALLCKSVMILYRQDDLSRTFVIVRQVHGPLRLLGVTKCRLQPYVIPILRQAVVRFR